MARCDTAIPIIGYRNEETSPRPVAPQKTPTLRPSPYFSTSFAIYIRGSALPQDALHHLGGNHRQRNIRNCHITHLPYFNTPPPERLTPRAAPTKTTKTKKARQHNIHHLLTQILLQITLRLCNCNIRCEFNNRQRRNRARSLTPSTGKIPEQRQQHFPFHNLTSLTNHID